MFKLRLEKIDKVLISGATSTAILAGTMLFWQPFGLSYELSETGAQEIGLVSRRESDVRRRFYKSLTWSNVQTNTLLYENDSIFTGADSRAELELSYGASISLAPSTLIILQRHSGQVLLDLRLGSIETRINANTKFLVKQGGRHVEVLGTHWPDTRLRVRRTPENELIFSAENQGVRIKADEDIGVLAPNLLTEVTPENEIHQSSLDSQNLETLEQTAPEPVYPPAGFLTRTFPRANSTEASSKTFSFYWTDQFGAKSYNFQLSPDPEFAEILIDKRGLQSLRVDVKVPTGQFYWRVRAEAPQGVSSAWSAARPFSVQRATESLPTANGTIATLPPYKMNLDLVAGKSQLDVITEAPAIVKLEPMKQKLKKRPKISLYFLDSVGSREPAADFREFIERNDPETLESAKLEKQLQWSSLPEAVSYEVQVRLLTQPQSLYEKIETKDATTLLELKDPGDYSIQTQAYDAEKRAISSLSNALHIRLTKKLTIEPPLLQSPENGSIFLSLKKNRRDDRLVLFEWQEIPFATHFELQLARDSQFKEMLTERKTKEPYFVYTEDAPKGKVYWRVRAVYQDKKTVLSEWSLVNHIQVN